MNLTKYDISKLAINTNIVILGKRGTGKTVLMRDLLYRLSTQLDFGVAFSPTESSREMFAEILPRACIYPEFKYDVLETMLNFQRSKDDINATPEERERNRGWRRNLFCVLDDCLYDKDILKGKAINDLFMNGRHQTITLVVIAQDVMALAPPLRNNADYVFAFKDSVVSSRAKLFYHYFGVVGDLKTFHKAMRDGTKDKRALMLDNRTSSTNPEDCMFYYKAQLELPKFHVGRMSFYRLTAKHAIPPGQQIVQTVKDTVHVEEDDGLPPAPPPVRAGKRRRH